MFVTLNPAAMRNRQRKEPQTVRLGGPLFTRFEDPDQWINALRAPGYRAAYCPLDTTASQDKIKAYRKAAEEADIIISEVGAWSNPISPDEVERNTAIDKCIKSLRLADEIGASCCVNISGSRNKDQWAGPHKDNLTNETFDMVVETTRKIIDAVNPTQTWFTLEAMPWSFPHSPDAYIRLLKAVDRERFAAHLDPVNMIVSPEIYFNNGDMLKECFRKLGPYIKSCHAKDMILREDIYTPHLDEVRPGLGALRYDIFLNELSRLQDVPLMMEHLETQEEYKMAADYIREVGRNHGVKISKVTSEL
jgi:sugar phosphate isomerase/epimerase